MHGRLPENKAEEDDQLRKDEHAADRIIQLFIVLAFVAPAIAFVALIIAMIALFVPG
ncbi:MAG TPA: hypothetical protein PLV61_13325 [Parvularculaceae bacterium]|nr:hypothetical protein [Caulobacterales bacterium]HOP18905.1 hypothetical protein [Amphiplicatus sp.]HPE32168.1 hypothetical protein [Parvularculaceae bacterium]HRX38727.1 hypothetical protein [Parvularculaceae bacterium]